MNIFLRLYISRVTILSSILFLLFSVPSYSQSGWFSQPLPVNGQVNDLKFFNANTGLISMNPAITLRTTNGGYNWTIILPGQYVGNFEQIDSNTIYANGMNSSAYGMLLRTFNRGITWDSFYVPGADFIGGVSFVNKDTGWVGSSIGGEPFLWKTTNGGINWTVNSTVTGRGKVFFLKYKVNGEYIGWSQDPPNMYKTTNSGNTWFQIMNIAAASQIYFIDENTGWAATGDNVRKSTNGGLNWTQHFLPTGFNIAMRTLQNFKHLNKDTIYGVGAFRNFGNVYRGIIWISTNGGVNWNFQQPDTSIGRLRFYGIDFVNKDTGFSDWIRTNDGGGPIIMPTYIPNNGENAAGYELMQNYPNPFNSSTAIELSVPKDSYVSLKITDLTGKTVFRVLYEMPLRAGTHKFTINGFGKLNLASGVYFYTIDSRDMYSNKTRFAQTRKMVYLK